MKNFLMPHNNFVSKVGVVLYSNHLKLHLVDRKTKGKLVYQFHFKELDKLHKFLATTGRVFNPEPIVRWINETKQVKTYIGRPHTRVSVEKQELSFGELYNITTEAHWSDHIITIRKETSLKREDKITINYSSGGALNVSPEELAEAMSNAWAKAKQIVKKLVNEKTVDN